MDTPMGKCVLVTGGRGFVGRALVAALRGTGYRVLTLDQSSISDGARGDELVIDITEAEQLRSVFVSEKVSAVVHLAAILPTAAQRDPVQATRVNIDGSVYLLELAREFGVGRVVFGSSLSIYGTCAPDRTVSEADRAAPEDLYGASKLYVERFGAVYGDGRGLELVSLRIGRVVGPGARSTTSAWRSEIFELLDTRQHAAIAIPYVESERILVVHVEDLASMLVTLLRTPKLKHTIYNAVCESVVVGELKDAVEALNSNIKVRLGEGLAVGNPRRLDSSRFRDEFGFQGTSIFERLKRSSQMIRTRP